MFSPRLQVQGIGFKVGVQISRTQREKLIPEACRFDPAFELNLNPKLYSLSLKPHTPHLFTRMADLLRTIKVSEGNIEAQGDEIEKQKALVEGCIEVM